MHHHGSTFPFQDVAAAGGFGPLLQISLFHQGEGNFMAVAVVSCGPDCLWRRKWGPVWITVLKTPSGLQHRAQIHHRAGVDWEMGCFSLVQVVLPMSCRTMPSTLHRLESILGTWGKSEHKEVGAQMRVWIPPLPQQMCGTSCSHHTCRFCNIQPLGRCGRWLGKCCLVEAACQPWRCF
jgi:hypothetical protein